MIKGKHTGIERPDGKSNLSVGIHSIKQIANCKPSQEKTNKNVADIDQGEVVEGMQPET